ncbi:MAG TPA: hypothetical protein VIV06_12525, partial [Candidatus Limnocylindrales bacterium]
MDPTTLIVLLALAVLIVVAVAAVIAGRRRRSEQLRSQFGPEYERVVKSRDVRDAEAELDARRRRVEELEIRPLDDVSISRYSDAWRATQARFVDDPAGAVADADRLLGEVMAARGYPMADFEQRAADISVNHADVVEHYRAAHAIAARQAAGQATTEELRQALVHCRALFEDLLGDRPGTSEVGARQGTGSAERQPIESAGG